MTRILLLCLLFASVVVFPISCSSDSSTTEEDGFFDEISELMREEHETPAATGDSAEQKAQVVALALERAVTGQSTDNLTVSTIPGYNLMEDKEHVILSTVNIHPSWVPQFPGVSFALLTDEEIQAKADTEGDFLYLHFGRVDAVDESTVVVKLECFWAIGKNSPHTGYLSGGGFVIKYHHQDGKWTGEEMFWWIY